MNQRIYSLFFVLMFMLFGNTALASEHADGGEKAFNPSELINHHIYDTHEWHIATLNEGEEGEFHITIPLPVIVKDAKGWHFFMSSSVAHGEVVDGYTLEHGVLVNKEGLEKAQIPDLFKGTEKVFYDLSITKNVFALFISVLIILGLFISMANSYKKSLVPTGVARFFEPVVLLIRDGIAIPNIGSKHYKKFMPFLLTIFFFIWLNNLIGLVSFFPGGANLTGNIAVTLVLSLFTLFTILLNANKDYWKHIFWPPVPFLLKPIMIPLEIIGIFTKPFSLTMRLMANITAGHIMILSIISLIFIFKNAALGAVSVPLALFVSILELLVAALQAYIFTILSALYIGIAVAEHGHDDAHGHAEEH